MREPYLDRNDIFELSAEEFEKLPLDQLIMVDGRIKSLGDFTREDFIAMRREQDEEFAKRLSTIWRKNRQ